MLARLFWRQRPCICGIADVRLQALSSSSQHDCGSRAGGCSQGRSGLGSTPCRAAASAADPDATGQQKGLISPDLQAYVDSHIEISETESQLRERTQVDWPRAAHMMVPVDEGGFLGWLVQTLGCRRAIELGTFTGYSALLLAQALPQDGRLICCEQDERPLTLAKEMWRQAGVLDKIEVKLGPAADTLQGMIDHGELDVLDFAFIDADKRGSIGYFEQLLKLVRLGGVIVVDNVLWYGRVADAEDQSAKTQAIRDLNQAVSNDERVHVSLLTVGDGMLLIRRCK